jgi:hypothetical protein
MLVSACYEDMPKKNNKIEAWIEGLKQYDYGGYARGSYVCALTYKVTQVKEGCLLEKILEGLR